MEEMNGVVQETTESAQGSLTLDSEELSTSVAEDCDEVGNASVTDDEDEFLHSIGNLFSSLLAPENLTENTVDGQQITLGDILVHAETCAHVLQDEALPTATTLSSTIEVATDMALLQRCVDAYRSEMSASIKPNQRPDASFEEIQRSAKEHTFDLYKGSRKMADDEQVDQLRQQLDECLASLSEDFRALYAAIETQLDIKEELEHIYSRQKELEEEASGGMKTESHGETDCVSEAETDMEKGTSVDDSDDGSVEQESKGKDNVNHLPDEFEEQKAAPKDLDSGMVEQGSGEHPVNDLSNEVEEKDETSEDSDFGAVDQRSEEQNNPSGHLLTDLEEKSNTPEDPNKGTLEQGSKEKNNRVSQILQELQRKEVTRERPRGERPIPAPRKSLNRVKEIRMKFENKDDTPESSGHPEVEPTAKANRMSQLQKELKENEGTANRSDGGNAETRPKSEDDRMDQFRKELSKKLAVGTPATELRKERKKKEEQLKRISARVNGITSKIGRGFFGRFLGRFGRGLDKMFRLGHSQAKQPPETGNTHE